VRYAVARNSNDDRTGTIRIGGVDFTVTQKHD
jgi:hypothetical protein